MLLLLAPLYGVIHALRGADVPGFQKAYAPIWFAVLTALISLAFLNYTVWQLFIIFWIIGIGYYIGISLGWGKYFNVAFPNMAYVSESEVPWIDMVCNDILGVPTTLFAFERWCFLAFFFRSWLFYPMFLGLSFYNDNALCIGLGVLLMPVVYWARRFWPDINTGIRACEFTYGAVLGLLILACVGGH